MPVRNWANEHSMPKDSADRTDAPPFSTIGACLQFAAGTATAPATAKNRQRTKKSFARPTPRCSISAIRKKPFAKANFST